MSTGNMANHYLILGIARTATGSEIRRAYLARSLETHPDKQGNIPEANAQFRAVKEAYDILSDANKRAIFDAQLADQDPQESEAAPSPSWYTSEREEDEEEEEKDSLEEEDDDDDDEQPPTPRPTTHRGNRNKWQRVWSPAAPPPMSSYDAAAETDATLVSLGQVLTELDRINELLQDNSLFPGLDPEVVAEVDLFWRSVQPRYQQALNVRVRIGRIAPDDWDMVPDTANALLEKVAVLKQAAQAWMHMVGNMALQVESATTGLSSVDAVGDALRQEMEHRDLPEIKLEIDTDYPSDEEQEVNPGDSFPG